MNKVVLITGASGDIGKAICQKFAKNNYSIVFHYNNNLDNDFIKNLSNQTKVLTVKANFENKEQLEELCDVAVKTFGKIDVLVNNAGIDLQNPIVDETYENLSRCININLNAPLFLSHLVAKEMCKQQSGNIVNISSIWGVYGGSCEAIYSASKAGIIGMTKALSKELGPNNIRVNAVAPGLINTKMNSNLTQTDIQNFLDGTSFGRIGTPEDIANLVYFLSSEESSYITGQIILADGGLL